MPFTKKAEAKSAKSRFTLRRIKTACAEHTTSDGQKLSDIKPGQNLDSFRTHGCISFMVVSNTAALLWAVIELESPYWTAHAITLCLGYYLWILAWESLRPSRTIVHKNGITRTSWFRGTFYPWESIQKIVWAKKYVEASSTQAYVSNSILPAHPGFFFIDINDKPRISVRFPWVYRYDRVLKHIPDTVTIEEYEQRLDDYNCFWYDITPFWQQRSIRQINIEFCVTAAVPIATFTHFPFFHYLNEFFLHIPK